MTIDSIYKDLRARKFSPVYFFCGEEPYYIDQLTQYIEQNVLSEDEREFNQSVLYGIDVTPDEVVGTAKRFPMMSDYQVVIIKEAQLLKKAEELDKYLLHPQKSTILVIAWRGKEPDKRKSFGKNIEKNSVYFKSDRLKDEKIPEWVSNYLHKKSYRITAQAAIMVAEFVGNELEKIVNEADKLMANFPPGYEIKEKDVELQVGISKEYNVFEFQKALGTKNILKANQIAFHMAANPKNHPIQMTLGSLFGFFSKILHYQWLKSKNQTNYASAMSVPPFFIKDYETAARNYSPAKLMRIMQHLRAYDLRSKGFNSDTDSSELIKELTFKIIH